MPYLDISYDVRECIHLNKFAVQLKGECWIYAVSWHMYLFHHSYLLSLPFASYITHSLRNSRRMSTAGFIY
jgi:hypothetical protein